jgi:hypothetical protein
MRWLRASLGILLFTVVAGCATPYGTEGLTGGYSEKQLEPDTWRITFSGNGFTTRETAQTFWLYRSAELAIQNGYDGFQILSDMQFVSYDRDNEGIKPILVHGGGGGGGFVFIPMDGPPKPVIEGDVKFLKKPITASPPKVFDAVALKAELEPLVKGKLCEGNVCAHVHHYLIPNDNAQPAPVKGA